MKKILFLVFLFSMCSATLYLTTDFISHFETDYTGHMYREDAASTVYYVDEDIQYHLNTHMEVSDPDQYLGGPIGSSWNDLYSGSYVCEGGFEYDTLVEALAMDFHGRIPSYSEGSTWEPSDWPSCSGNSACNADTDVYVDWDQPDYNNYKDAWVMPDGPFLDSPAYTSRSITYQEAYGDPWVSNRISHVATVGKGTASLKRGGTTIYSFGTLSGQHPSHSGTFSLHPASYTVYTFTQRMDVTGMLMGVYNPNNGADDRENFMAYTSTNGEDPYSNSNIHDTGTLYVYPEENVGVNDPEILWVDLRDDGSFPMTEVVTPGETFPVRMRMRVPAAYLGFWPLAFEFYNPEAFIRTDLGGGMVSQFPLDWDVTTGIDQCPPGIKNIFGTTYNIDIVGNVHIPESAAPGAHQLGFGVSWQTCSGEEDCDGNGQDDDLGPTWITVFIPDTELPDLVCEIEPIAYVDGIEMGSDGEFSPGQGVEEWRVTVTNIGDDDFNIPGAESAACTLLGFQSYSSDGTGSHDPFYYEWLTSIPGSIGIDESVTFDIDGTAICIDETGEVRAEALVNWLWVLYPECIPFRPVEISFDNNYCEWAAPCGEGAGDPEECTIVPSLVTNPDSGEVINFDLYCDGDPCTGSVTWTDTPTGDYIGEMTDWDQNGATVEITDYSVDDVPVGSLLLEAAVASPNNMECEALIVLEMPPPPGDCTIVPSNVDDPLPGSIEDFDLYCDGDPCTGDVDWDTTESGDHIGDMTYWDQFGATVEIVEYTDEDELSGYMVLEATVDFPDNMVCNATITLNNDGPPDDDGDCDLHCEIHPYQVVGGPGFYQRFTLWCFGEDYPEGGELCNGDWEFTAGEEYVYDHTPMSGISWLDVYLYSSLVIEGESEEVRIRAEVGDDDCSARCPASIELPPMDCFDYI